METHSRGFTLIELLVVISIIGLLASIVLVALSSARTKGQIGASLEFASTNYHAFGANAIGYWNFDEACGGAIAIATPALDQSGNKRNLLPYSSVPNRVLRSATGMTPTGNGCSL